VEEDRSSGVEGEVNKVGGWALVGDEIVGAGEDEAQSAMKHRDPRF